MSMCPFTAGYKKDALPVKADDDNKTDPYTEEKNYDDFGKYTPDTTIIKFSNEPI